jgi:hypothetical protein
MKRRSECIANNKGRAAEFYYLYGPEFKIN